MDSKNSGPKLSRCGTDMVTCIVCRSREVYPMPCTCRVDLYTVNDGDADIERGCDFMVRLVNIHFIEHQKCAQEAGFTPVQKKNKVTYLVGIVRTDFADLYEMYPKVVTFSADDSLREEIKLSTH